MQGQAFTLFIITVAACEAAIALALILMLYRSRRSLDVSLWQELREPGQEPTVDEEPLPPLPPREAPLAQADAGRPGARAPPGGEQPCLTCASYLWLIPALPLAASVVTGRLRPATAPRHSHWPCILAVAASCVLSVIVLVAGCTSIARQCGPGNAITPGSRRGNVDVGFTLRADALTAVMLVTVTFIGTLDRHLLRRLHARRPRAIPASSPRCRCSSSR